MRINVHSAILICSALAVFSRAAVTQAPLRIDAALGPSCTGCTITLEKVASYGSLNDPDNAGFASAIAVDSQGRAFITSRTGQSILMYDRAGMFVRAIGRGGGGPGEFRQAVQLAFGVRDSLYVVDGALRVAVYTPALDYSRSFALTIPSSRPFVPLPSGELVVTAPVSSRVPVARVGEGGKREGFGLSDTTERDRCVPCVARVIGASRVADRVWVVATNSYTIEEWSVSGALSRQMYVAGSWFAAWSVPGVRDLPPPPGFPPRTTINDVVEDISNRLWIGAYAPARNWTPMPPRPAPDPGSGFIPIPLSEVRPNYESLKRLATVIDVLDPKTSRLVVSQRFDGRVIRLLLGELAYEVREDSNGLAIFDVYRLAIKRP